MRVVMDIESNGLLNTANILWCAVAYDIDTHATYEFILKDNEYDEFQTFMDNVDVWIGHNIIGYDIPLLSKLNVYQYTGAVCDTLIYSRTLDPDRALSEGCPTHIQDPITGKKKIVGSHSLEAWGYRVSRSKPYIERWDIWSDKILHRCKEDVIINYKTLQMLLEEAELEDIVTV